MREHVQSIASSALFEMVDSDAAANLSVFAEALGHQEMQTLLLRARRRSDGSSLLQAAVMGGSRGVVQSLLLYAGSVDDPFVSRREMLFQQNVSPTRNGPSILIQSFLLNF